MIRYVLILALLMGGLACAQGSFEADEMAWRDARDAALRRPDGWLTLAGLFWLVPGTHTFGSGTDNELRFPASAPVHIGTFVLDGDTLSVQVEPRVEARVDDRPVRDWTFNLKAAEGSQVMRVGTLSWYPIVRDGRVGIRLKDSQSPLLATFEGQRYYPLSNTQRVWARFVPYPTPRSIEAPSALGTSRVTCPGVLEFTLQGHPLHLLAFAEPEDTEFEVIFGDRTNGHGTYPAGRYVDVARPAADGRTVIDFNHAYNPPCSFTGFATCVFPPPENRLPLSIEAGEKFTGH